MSPQFLETEEVCIQSSSAYLITPRGRNVSFAETSQHGTYQHYRASQRGSHLSITLRIDAVYFHSVCLKGVSVCGRFVYLYAEIFQEFY